ncbi:hypothetical protein DFR24_4366 [Panacagrimonas perspica]|uniref:Uncharacterized protein n=1 Tax=Panacagrimonas perspica TaxID=381431 RepID=A0A4S3K3U8_9GAMM|nr:hypothetical protein [Panacagrimonas perspica]TDU25919.1 hypothetical protein DFR24_4366 [Panacagrimonas perspica]THD02722.1 hypothetical protein B1810_12400 [Panacagrimonas perspica]
MAASLKLVFRSPVVGYVPDERRGLARLLFDKRFEQYTAKLGVRPLVDFYSTDPADLDWQIDDPIERERLKAKLGPAQYFPATDCLRTVHALLQALAEPKARIPLPPLVSKDGLARELIGVAEGLLAAEDQGVSFYLDNEM